MTPSAESRCGPDVGGPAEAAPSGPLRVAGLLAVGGFGGSQNSAASVCKYLAASGHDVALFCDVQRAAFAFSPGQARLEHLPACPILPEYRRNARLVNLARLISACRRRRFDAILAFNPAALMLATGARLATGVPTVLYLLGKGATDLTRHHRGRVVANSTETARHHADLTGRRLEEIPVLRARIDVALLEGQASRPCPQLELLPDVPHHIALATRLATTKIGMLTNAIAAADLVAGRRDDACLILAGDGPLRGRFQQQAAAVNRRHNRPVVTFLGHVENVAALFSGAAIVIGVGRGLWEGMALGKPAVVVGESGLAGVVRPETVEELGYYNFAGRNVTQPVAPERLAEELLAILGDADYAAELGSFSRRFILEHFDARAGAAQMEQVLRRAADEDALPPSRRFTVLPEFLLMAWAEAVRTAKGIVKSMIR